MDLIEDIIHQEWEQFDKVQNVGGRASCQDNFREFYIMRYSQFSQWPQELLEHYRNDLTVASEEGRNLLTEKYARMMAYTAPAEYEQLRSHLKAIPRTDLKIIEQIIAIQLNWHTAFSKKYPNIASRGRATSGSSTEDTSVEVYLQGELETYSTSTLQCYLDFLLRLEHEGGNLVEQTIAATAELNGFRSLDSLEDILSHENPNKALISEP